MDMVKQTKLQLNISYWSKIVSECQGSGMNVTAGCKENSIDKRNYYYWLRKIRETAYENMPTISKLDIVPVASIPNNQNPGNVAARIKFGNISVEIMNNA